jgi:hypothetical protein
VATEYSVLIELEVSPMRDLMERRFETVYVYLDGASLGH